jgi:hypothetical protein
MYSPRIPHEVNAGPGVASEKDLRRQVSLEPIAGTTRHDEVARCVCPTPRHGNDVVQGRQLRREVPRTVDATTTTVSQRGVFQGPLLCAQVVGALEDGLEPPATRIATGVEPQEATSGHDTLPNGDTPHRRGRGGVWREVKQTGGGGTRRRSGGVTVLVRVA